MKINIKGRQGRQDEGKNKLVEKHNQGSIKKRMKKPKIQDGLHLMNKVMEKDIIAKSTKNRKMRIVKRKQNKEKISEKLRP